MALPNLATTDELEHEQTLSGVVTPNPYQFTQVQCHGRWSWLEP